jgi:cytochrome c-type biogenesis protein CcmE
MTVQDLDQPEATQTGSSGRAKFIIGGLLIVAAIVYLIVTSTQASAQYFLTVDELANRKGSEIGRDVRVSGAVLGDTIEYDADTLTLKFSLAKVLNDAVNDPNRTQLQVVYIGPKPDLLRHEAQAIMTGKMGEDGVFYADELLLKCPTKYEEAVPEQSEG